MLEFGLALLLGLGVGGGADLHEGLEREGDGVRFGLADPDRPPPEEGGFVIDAGEVIRGTFRSPHGDRAYRLYLPPPEAVTAPEPTGHPGMVAVPTEPPATPADPRAPLLVLLHGCTQDADDFARGTRMDRLARERGVAVLYPEQSTAANATRCWNWFEPGHQARGRGEPALLAALIEQTVRDRDLDPERVFVAGISAGGAMAAILAASYPDRIAAVASHSGVPFGAARGLEEALGVLDGSVESPPHDLPETLLAQMGERARPVPMLVLHGERDEVVSPRNADWFAAQWSRYLARVTGAPTVEELNPLRQGAGPGTRIRVLKGISGELYFEMWRIAELGHAWSGGSEEGSYTDPAGPDASRIVMEFFLDRRAR